MAIYDNPHGDIVIRQEREWNEEHDPFIVIARAHAIRAAHSILEAVGLGDIEFIQPCGGGYENVPIWTDVAPRMVSRSDVDGVLARNGLEAEATGSSRLSQRRELVAEALQRDPNRSDRPIAGECGVSDKTVGAVRAEIGAEIRDDTAELRAEGEQLRLVAAE